MMHRSGFISMRIGNNSFQKCRQLVNLSGFRRS